MYKCTICPRQCDAEINNGKSGYCKKSDGYPVAKICVHHGEEPVLTGPKGVCNIFFYHCNLQCIYCQNYQISRNTVTLHEMDIRDILNTIIPLLDSGIRCVGFVSPSHVIPQMIEIIHAINSTGRKPVYVMNTGAYDKKETLESLEGLIDVYLPDFKYMDRGIALQYSGVLDYPTIGVRALREMYRQKGSNILIGEDGIIESGLIIRHLILPNHVDNSKKCLRSIAEELSTRVHISLMSQYYPIYEVRDHFKLSRPITEAEYREVVDELHKLGFNRGWIQDYGSYENFLPNFESDTPFLGIIQV